ncbi:response regulator [bacterium]|nr:response regulator [bacterium]
MASILVVDDDERVREVLNLQLVRSGHKVTLTSDGDEAIRLPDLGSFDVVITDIRMPRVSGEEVVRFILERFPTLPVIVLTGVIDIDMAIRVMRMGAFDYLIKPVRREDLLFVIAKALQFKRLKEENIRLEEENRRYQSELEEKIRERTRELTEALDKLKRSYIDTVKSFSALIEAKDPALVGHGERVAFYAKRILAHFDHSEKDASVLEFASILHDIGKVVIDSAILRKIGPLSSMDRLLLKDHPVIGAEVIKHIEFLSPAADIIRHHHEHFDGTGYPDGLSGEEIPFLARILTVADSFDAMVTDRPYREALDVDYVINYMIQQKGKIYDPRVVDVFVGNKIYEAKIKDEEYIFG